MAEPVIVLGAGITGLACAYVLSRNHKVTIIARDLPGDLNLNWASPWAGAVFHPQQPATPPQKTMQTASFHFYHALAQQHLPTTGVAMYPMTEYFDHPVPDGKLWFDTLMPDYRVLPPDALPADVSFGVKYTTVAVNPTLFLPWIYAELRARGVRFIRATAPTLSSARSIAQSHDVAKAMNAILVNATGLGARDVAGDASVRAIRGQTLFVPTRFAECVMRSGREYTYVIPRAGSGGVILGGVKMEGREDGVPDGEVREDILRRVRRITGGGFEGVREMGMAEGVRDIVGFRPGRVGGLRVEREGRVVHAYGMEGAGYIYSFGVAERVRELVEGMRVKAML